jgi:SAM-dependent methyltransferase
MSLVCPHCRVPLESAATHLACPRCARVFPRAGGIADFSEGLYYDRFDESTELTPEHLAGLAQEVAGAAARIDDYYLPLIRTRAESEDVRILDSGCGNGLSVDILSRAGFDAWGHDLSALRKWQWRERERRERLVVADALRLPFPDGFFDFVLSSGVIEHLGVRESGGERYRVEPLPSRDAVRRDYLAELLRVCRGSLFLDCPNGAFPIDFWHGTKPGGMRWHSPREGFLATFSQIERLAREAEPAVSVRALSPHRRLRFEQVGRHWYGRAFAIPAGALLRAMNTFTWLARSPLNPYLVVEIAR